ncbi:hypothetical protein [Photobacterium sanguinicancri]|uniref:Type 4 fimbrial biogenesis protein PilX N-terminal domain-containing protein n=1 Tax=Photobacterium sanguinicancri TaxID=875932 RepID=A0ABX4FZC0_9GAMM|nr:hypothetical protein [Photobacterium sanguinicancri]OZS44166.1 hypothetical protein ASV53_09610 [Photobacterium sanguinicancri]
MMNKQRGAITLLVTSMVAVASLLFSLASYKNTYYQIKRTQNEVLTSQAHWKAEGGLECGYSTMKNSSNPANADMSGFFPSGCNSELGVTLKAIKIPSSSDFVLSSNYAGRANKHIERTVVVNSANNSSGVLQTGSNMYTRSSIMIELPDPGIEKGDGWECIAVRARDIFEPAGGLVNQGLRPKPFFDPKGKNCLPSHFTRGSPFKKDIVKDPAMSPFEDFFGVKDLNHEKVRKEKFDVTLADKNLKDRVGDIYYDGFSGCGPAIVDALNKGSDKIWVEGHCDINGADFGEMIKASIKLKGVMLLIHDGQFSMFPNNKSSSSNQFEGIIFHYNLDYKIPPNQWANSQACAQICQANNNFRNDAIGINHVENSSFYLFGSLWISGGFILDAKYKNSDDIQNALLETSAALTYNGKYFSKFGGGSSGEVKWLKGSWNDF